MLPVEQVLVFCVMDGWWMGGEWNVDLKNAYSK
jgi:hypothetical protein